MDNSPMNTSCGMDIWHRILQDKEKLLRAGLCHLFVDVSCTTVHSENVLRVRIKFSDFN